MSTVTLTYLANLVAHVTGALKAYIVAVVPLVGSELRDEKDPLPRRAFTNTHLIAGRDDVGDFAGEKKLIGSTNLVEDTVRGVDSNADDTRLANPLLGSWNNRLTKVASPVLTDNRKELYPVAVP